MPLTPPLSDLLREHRLAAGLSQSALAARMGTTQSAIARAEGRMAPAATMAFLERFVAATGRPLVAEVVPDNAQPPTMAEVSRLGARIRSAAAQAQLQRVRVVGSVARGAARPDSDIDLLVTAAPSLRGAAYFAALDEFRQASVRILRRDVDVIDEKSVSSQGLRTRLLAEARPL